MPRRPRLDRPGLLHHVMNRGLGRRPAFESRDDVRKFLSLVARAVRDGRIEVHAYVVLSTHFHLLLRSLDGRLSETLRWIEHCYVRWFNRKRGRDGPLFRGRFRSIPVESVRYCHTLIRYIDQNGVEAGLAADPADYPYGSARHHASGPWGPAWLCRDLVRRFVDARGAPGLPSRDAYARAFPLRLTPALRRLVGRRMAGQARGADALDSLLRGDDGNIHAWMRRNALSADGTRLGLPLVAPQTVAALVRGERRHSPDWTIAVGARSRRGVWDLALVALLHDLAGESQAAIARRLRISTGDVHRRRDEHRRAFVGDASYAEIVTRLGRIALHADHPDLPDVDLGPSRPESRIRHSPAEIT